MAAIGYDFVESFYRHKLSILRIDSLCYRTVSVEFKQIVESENGRV